MLSRPVVPFLALAMTPLVSPHRSSAQEIPFTRFELPSGLTVILHADHRLPLVSVNIWYYVGSKDEPPGRSGFAHLFEHLMFMGTKEVPYPQFDVIMEKSGGSNNASTSEDRTNYFETGPKDLLDTFLYLEADRMASLGDSMDQEKLDTQRKVVRNERRQSYENRPYGQAELEVPERMYPESHPYHHTVIGSHEDLERATVNDVKDFFRRFYFPKNASLVIAGDFDPGQARALVEKHFGSMLPRPPVEHATSAPPVRLDAVRRAELKDEVEMPLVLMVWHSPPVFARGDADMDTLASILGGGKSSRLYRALVYEQKLAQEVEVNQLSSYLGSLFEVRVFARPEASLDAIEAAVDREIERLKADGPTSREVERARNRIETQFWKGLEGVRERADRLNRYQFHFGDPGAIGRDRARYDAVTPATAQTWARETLLPKARLILRVVPKAHS